MKAGRVTELAGALGARRKMQRHVRASLARPTRPCHQRSRANLAAQYVRERLPVIGRPRGEPFTQFLWPSSYRLGSSSGSTTPTLAACQVSLGTLAEASQSRG